jgi:hypothetical protein|tara:strand:+ start:174 stop:350 length:177 start_codon:yes stop_codon:yes gene_type:complete
MKVMKQYTIYATVTTQLETVIEADTLEAAQEIADQELITGDFDATHSEFTLLEVVEVK